MHRFQQLTIRWRIAILASAILVSAGIVTLLVIVDTAALMRFCYHAVVILAALALAGVGVVMVAQWLENAAGQQVTPAWMLVGGVAAVVLALLLLHLHAYTLATIPAEAVESVYGSRDCIPTAR